VDGAVNLRFGAVNLRFGAVNLRFGAVNLRFGAVNLRSSHRGWVPPGQVAFRAETLPL
jgi:hypothetical protein